VSTLQMERGGSVLTPSPAEHRVPDHVPADVAAEHPDAASVVAREPDLVVADAYTVETVDRPRRRYTRAGLVLTLAACALVAALVPGSGSDRDDAPVTTVTAGSTTTTAGPSDDQSPMGAAPLSSTCPPGTSVVVQCGSATCAPVSLWSPLYGPCGPAANARR